MGRTYIIITVLVICALLYLYLGRTENFIEDPLVAAHAQDRMNYLGANTNPAKNPAVPIGISVAEAAKIREMSMVALNSYDQKYPAAGGIVNTLPGEKEGFTTGMNIATSLPISDETSMLGLEKYCKDNAKGTNPFSDAKFAEFCGVCMVDGSKPPPKNIYSDGTPIPGNEGGVLVYPEDKAVAYTKQQENGYHYPRALPSLGRAKCGGATTSDDDSRPPTLAIDANMYSDIRKRNLCVATQDFAPDGSCGKCVGDPTKWSYVKNPPEGNINNVLLVLVGSGLVTVLSNGQQVLADGKNLIDVALSTTPLVVNLGNYNAGGSLRGYIKEGERFSIIVKPNNLAFPYIGGFIKSTDPNGNPYVQELYNIVQNDSANAGNSPLIGYPGLSVSGMGFSVKRMVPGNNVSREVDVKMNLICEMPLTFISPTMDPTSKKSQIAYYDCKSGPYTTTAAHADLLIKDECSGQSAGNYTDTCLKSRILAAGCSTGGTWYRVGLPPEAGTNTNTLGNISSWINEKKLEPTNVATSMGCYGINLSSPCDGNKAGSPECLAYMYKNTSEKNILEGPAYSTAN